MTVYDISQPLFECEVWPGDPKPEKHRILCIENGDDCNLTEISLCAHNGTHVDAPLHFIPGGKGIGELRPEKFIGPCFVADCAGMLSGDDARRLLRLAENACPGAEKKLLLKGNTTVTAEAAAVFAASEPDLIGNESQTVGPEDAPAEVHRILLGAEVVLLEGIRLSAVPQGVYLLNCAPLNLSEADGSPCRAVLLELPLESLRSLR